MSKQIRNNSLARTPSSPSTTAQHPWNPAILPPATYKSARFQQVLVQKAMDNSQSQIENQGWSQIMERIPLLLEKVNRDAILRQSVHFATSAIGQDVTTECLTPYTPAPDFKLNEIYQGTFGSPIFELTALSIAYAVHHEEELVKHHLDVAWNVVFLMTDGQATDRENRAVVDEANALALDHKVDVIIFATGENPDMAVLNSMCQPGKKPVPMGAMADWDECFANIYTSLRRASRGTLGRAITLAGVRLDMLR